MKKKKEDSGFKTGRPGLVFKNGKLYDFNRQSVLVMKSWPDPRAWLKTIQHPWRHDRKMADRVLCHYLHTADVRPSAEPPDLGQVEPDRIFAEFQNLWTPEERQTYLQRKRYFRWLDWRQQHVAADYLEMIPVPVRKALACYRKRQWHMMSLLARCPGALDLHRSNAALCFALASHWVFHKPAVTKPMRTARRLVNRKQKAILDWLGFPATESVRRVFCKIVPASVSVENLLYLRQTLAEPGWAGVLAHLPRINAGALRLINDRAVRPVLTPRFLEEVALDIAQDEEPLTFGILMDTFRMERQVGGRYCPEKFQSLKRLEDLHNELVPLADGRIRFHRGELPAFVPEPPYAGTPDIQPITDWDDLVAEGRIMHHCVASYAGEVGNGAVYIYRVTAPVRATVSICRRLRSWVPGQVKLACNGIVPKEIARDIFRELLSSPVPERQTTDSSGADGSGAGAAHEESEAWMQGVMELDVAG